MQDRKRNFTLISQYDVFIGCNHICDITIKDPTDERYALVKKIDNRGSLIYCRHPEATKLPDGSSPLCADYGSYQPKGLVDEVRRGEHRQNI